MTAPPDRFARVQVRGDMQAGETAEIPASVRELTARVDEAGFRALILVVALWEHDETPRAAVVAGYRAFSAELQAAVAGHLQALASSDPQEQDQAVKEITKQVNERVEEAIRDELGIGDVFDDIDDVVGSDILALTALPGLGAPAPVSLGFGAEQGGRLLFYRDANQDGTGDVANPAVIGLGGWQNILRLFSGGNGIVYSVDRRGRLLFYRDANQDGTGDVANPAVIGLGGWQNILRLFSGGNGILYAVDQAGRLLFYRDTTQDGTGDVANPTVIGQGGWRDFLHLFSAGNGIIYAVDPAVVGTDRYEITGRAELRTGPEIAFSRDSLHFSLLGIGESKTLPLTISSTGFTPLTVTVPTIPNRNFSWSPLQATLLPGQSVDPGSSSPRWRPAARRQPSGCSATLPAART